MSTTEEIRARARFFARREDLRAWFEQHHATESELWIAYHRKGSGREGVDYAMAVEEALCFGWIDGQVRSLGPLSYANRYTPRKSGSQWSRVNVGKLQELDRAGRLHPAGRRVFEQRGEENARGYSYEQAPRQLAPALEKRFRRERGAWSFFADLPPSYRRQAVLWVMSAKQEATRERRLQHLVAISERGQRLDPLHPGRDPGAPSAPAPVRKRLPRRAPAARS